MLDFTNFKLKDVTTDKEMYPGCETCDYGSEYITEIYFHGTSEVNGVRMDKTYKISINREYEYIDFSYGDLMKFILNKVDICPTISIEKFLEDLSIYILQENTNKSFIIPEIKMEEI